MLRLLPVIAGLVLIAGCALVPPEPPRPQCYSHPPLDYSPILVKINVHATYQVKDAQGFADTAPRDFFDALYASNYGKYELADGEVPNLILTLSITNDGQNHYGAHLQAYGNGEGYLFSYSWPQNYVTPARLLNDVASMVDRFITEGWHRGNC